jgi:hypothetical protein
MTISLCPEKSNTLYILKDRMSRVKCFTTVPGNRTRKPYRETLGSWCTLLPDRGSPSHYALLVAVARQRTGIPSMPPVVVRAGTMSGAPNPT